MERRLGLLSSCALVVASMIGAGVFTTSGFALADLGRPAPVLWAWAVGAVLALCGALSYGALARAIPESGGEYTFLSRSIHPLAGFLAGWVSLLAGFTAPIAAAALGLSAYLADSFQLAARPEWIGTLAIVLAGGVHAVRVREGVLLQNAAVGVKLLAIAVFIVVGAWRLPESAAAPALPTATSIGAFAVTLIWVSFAYSGWNAAVYVAGEVRDPERNLERSLVLATALVGVLYLALNAVFVYAAPVSELAGQPDVGAVAAEALGGPALRRAVAAIVALALFTSISSMVMAGPRVYQRMAIDGLLPRVIAEARGAPHAAVALQVVLAVIVVWITGLRELLSYIGFTLGLSAAATVAGLILLRRRLGAARIPIPGYPWVQIVFIAVTLVAAAFLALREPLQAAWGALTVVAGLPFYAWMQRGRSGFGFSRRSW